MLTSRDWRILASAMPTLRIKLPIEVVIFPHLRGCISMFFRSRGGEKENNLSLGVVVVRWWPLRCQIQCCGNQRQ